MFIFKILNIFFITFLPILFWGYLFSYINNDKLNKKRFIIWIIAWIFSVFPILYLDKIIDFFWLKIFNLFENIKNIWNFFWFLNLNISLDIFSLFLALLSIFIWFFLFKYKLNLNFFIKNILIFIFYIFIFSLFLYFLNFLNTRFGFLNMQINDNLYFKNIIFDSLKLIIFYYFLVAFLEEVSKHFNFLSSSLFEIKKVRDWVLFAIFVALWFSLAENFLYFFNIYKLNWFNWNFLWLYFSRSIFSVISHILASSFLAYFFTKAYLYYWKKFLKKEYIILFFKWLFFAILVHMIFDISLSLWFNLILFLYIIFAYLFISYIFIDEKIKKV